MKRSIAIDVSALPTYGFGSKSGPWWGAMGFIALEGMGFAIAIGTYLYLMATNTTLADSTARLTFGSGTAITILFVLSVVPNQLASNVAPPARPLLDARLAGCHEFDRHRRADHPRLLNFAYLNTRWDTDAYGSIVWFILGLHATHLATDLGDTIVLTVLMFTRHAQPRRFSDVTDNAFYWNFVVLAWLPLYFAALLDSAAITPVWQRRMSWAGLWVGAAAWAISLQANYALVPLVCDGRVFVVSAIAAALTLISLAAGFHVALAPHACQRIRNGQFVRRFVASSSWPGLASVQVSCSTLAIANQLIARVDPSTDASGESACRCAPDTHDSACSGPRQLRPAHARRGMDLRSVADRAVVRNRHRLLFMGPRTSGMPPGQDAVFGTSTWRRSWSGWLLLALALVSPLHWLGEHLFAAHMIEHELLMIVAAPLFAYARPSNAMIWSLPTSFRPSVGSIVNSGPMLALWIVIGHPLSETILHGSALWLWHAPALYTLALSNEAVHRVERLSFFFTGLLFWWTLMYGRGADRGERSSRRGRDRMLVFHSSPLRGARRPAHPIVARLVSHSSAVLGGLRAVAAGGSATRRHSDVGSHGRRLHRSGAFLRASFADCANPARNPAARDLI